MSYTKHGNFVPRVFILMLEDLTTDTQYANKNSYLRGLRDKILALERPPGLSDTDEGEESIKELAHHKGEVYNYVISKICKYKDKTLAHTSEDILTYFNKLVRTSDEDKKLRYHHMIHEILLTVEERMEEFHIVDAKSRAWMLYEHLDAFYDIFDQKEVQITIVDCEEVIQGLRKEAKRVEMCVEGLAKWARKIRKVDGLSIE